MPGHELSGCSCSPSVPWSSHRSRPPAGSSWPTGVWKVFLAVKPAGWTGLSLSSCGWSRWALGVLVAHQPSCNFSGAVPGFCSPQPLLEGLRPLLAPGQSSSVWTAGRTPPPRQRCLLIQNLGSLHRGRFESGPDTQWATSMGTYLRGLSWAREDEQISARRPESRVRTETAAHSSSHVYCPDGPSSTLLSRRCIL